MRLGTVAQLAAVHGEAIRTNPGVRLQRPLAAHSGTGHRRASVLGKSPDKSMQGHILDGSPTAEQGLFGAEKAVLEALALLSDMEALALLNDKLAGMDVSNVDEALRKEVLAKLSKKEAPENKKAMITSGAYKEGPPLPPVGRSQRPKPMSPRAHGQNGDSEKNIHWI